MIILHGDNEIASRNEYLRQKKETYLELSGDTLDLSSLITSFSTSSLFGPISHIAIIGLFSRRPSTAKKQITDYLECRSELELLLWEPKDVSAQLKGFPQKLITKFDFPKHIFTFLDNLDLVTYHKLLSQMPVEQIFASLVTRAHKVLTAESRSNKSLDILKLIEIDYQLKTGQLATDLSTALELLLVSL